MTFDRIFNTYLGLVGLGIVMFFLFNEPNKTASILGTAGDTTGDFVATLQGH